MSSSPTILTGIKPTGSPHVGNLVGAIRPALQLAKGRNAFLFIADYHALTTVSDPGELRQLTYEVAATWLALGLDPQETIFYRQSDIPEVFELTWILNCLTPKGLMNRAHAYKAIVQDNREKGVADEDVDTGVNMGIYDYPVLMAADIVLYSANLVPVGRDQQQHLEMTRDIAIRFNRTFGDVLTIPEAFIQDEVASIEGVDGRKMSKSYGNQLPLFAEPARLRKMVRRYVTDSTPVEAPKDPDKSALFQIYAQISDEDSSAALAQRMRAGNFAWSELKDTVGARLVEFLEEPRVRYEELMAHTERIDEILAAGAARASAVAVPLMERVRDAIGRPRLRALSR